MATLSPKALEHRRRVLEHQATKSHDRQRFETGSADPQMKIPLIGEAKIPVQSEKQARKQSRRRKVDQPKLENL